MYWELSDIQTAYQHVLVGVDESEQGRIALQVLSIRRRRLRNLTIVTVLELGSFNNERLDLSAVNKRRR